MLLLCFCWSYTGILKKLLMRLTLTLIHFEVLVKIRSVWYLFSPFPFQINKSCVLILELFLSSLSNPLIPKIAHSPTHTEKEG